MGRASLNASGNNFVAKKISNLRHGCSRTGTAYYLQTRLWEEDCHAQSPTRPDASQTRQMRRASSVGPSIVEISFVSFA